MFLFFGPDLLSFEDNITDHNTFLVSFVLFIGHLKEKSHQASLLGYPLNFCIIPQTMNVVEPNVLIGFFPNGLTWQIYQAGKLSRQGLFGPKQFSTVN